MKRNLKNKQTKDVKKSNFPSHTKGYYRFTKDFPSVTDSEGYRDNDVFVNSHSKKASAKRRLVLVFAVCIAFAYCVTMLGFSISKLPAEIAEPTDVDAFAQVKLTGYNASFLQGETLSYSSVENIIREYKILGIDTVVIEFKDAEGFFYFNTSFPVSAEATSKASDNAKNVIKEFQVADIAVFARVACFADDIYARNNQEMAAYVTTASHSDDDEPIKSIWYNSGNDSHAWLNPYSNEVLYYLRTIVTDVANLGVDGILFDYAVLPFDTDFSTVIFDGAEDNEITPAGKMVDFILLLNSTYVSCTTGVSISSQDALTAVAEQKIPDGVYSGCDFIVADLRPAAYSENTVLGEKLFKNPAASPAEFIVQYMDELGKLFESDESLKDVEIVPLLESGDGQDVQINAVADSGGKSYIIYSK